MCLGLAVDTQAQGVRWAHQCKCALRGRLPPLLLLRVSLSLGTIDGLLLLGSEGSPGMPGGIDDEIG